MSISINSNFDAGSIVVHDVSNPQNIRLGIRNDTNSEFAQWFYFQINGIQSQQLSIHFENLATTAYPEGWSNYNLCASYDNQNWFRLPCSFENNTLSCTFNCSSNSIYLAYFEPYSYQKHQELIGFANLHEICEHTILGYTAQQRPIDLLTIGKQDAQYKIWIIARQHPGETMAEWFMDGLIKRLFDKQDPISHALLSNCKFNLVPNMNPDGAILGNLRTNSCGVNLNREWLVPTIENSPEVFYVREKMLSDTVDMFFDIHGDEALPYVFTSGCADNQSFSQSQKQLEDAFEHIFQLINPDYQTEYGYPKNHFSVESSSVATKWVGNHFDCLAYTLELPFKDNANNPNIKYGWNGYRSQLLGQDLLTAIHYILKHN